jgi:hypothetical protein
MVSTNVYRISQARHPEHKLRVMKRKGEEDGVRLTCIYTYVGQEVETVSKFLLLSLSDVSPHCPAVPKQVPLVFEHQLSGSFFD